MSQDYLLQCPKCGGIFTKQVWKRRKSPSNLYYVCEKCHTKNHGDNLKRIYE